MNFSNIWVSLWISCIHFLRSFFEGAHIYGKLQKFCLSKNWQEIIKQNSNYPNFNIIENMLKTKFFDSTYTVKIASNFQKLVKAAYSARNFPRKCTYNLAIVLKKEHSFVPRNFSRPHKKKKKIIFRWGKLSVKIDLGEQTTQSLKKYLQNQLS